MLTVSNEEKLEILENAVNAAKWNLYMKKGSAYEAFLEQENKQLKQENGELTSQLVRLGVVEQKLNSQSNGKGDTE